MLPRGSGVKIMNFLLPEESRLAVLVSRHWRRVCRLCPTVVYIAGTVLQQQQILEWACSGELGAAVLNGKRLNADLCRDILIGAKKSSVWIHGLDLEALDMSGDGAKRGGRFLSRNTTCVAMRLSACHIGDDGVHSIGRALTPNHQLLQAGMFPPLASLALPGNDITQAAGGSLRSALLGAKALTALDLGGNRLGPEGCQVIYSCPAV